MLVDSMNHADPDLRPLPNSPAANGTVPVAAVPAGDSFFTQTNYIGAFSTSAAQDWTRNPAPWTTRAQGFLGFLGFNPLASGHVLLRNDSEDAVPEVPPGSNCCN